MGQAKRRGTREERIAQATLRTRAKTAQQALLPASPQEAQELDAKCNMLFADITTPDSINEQVSQFCLTLSAAAPVFLECMPELWSRQRCCEMNVTRYIEDHGGHMICGYRIWYHEPLYIEGERHAVWANGNELRDVSFVDTGETRTLFVPDEKSFDEAPPKVRFAFGDTDRDVLARYEAVMRMVPFYRMSPQDSWNTMPSYEQWLAGRRMPNLFTRFQ